MSAVKHRISELDAVRGFALCGIHVVNIYQQEIFPQMFGDERGRGIAVLPTVVRYGFYERFFPIFTLLFGISFAIFLSSAKTRTSHPRIVLARRLVALALIGVVHQLFHPGEALLPYALFGLIFLLPATFVRPRVTLTLGLVVLVLGAQTVAGYGVMPGLLLIGYGLGQLGIQNSVATDLRRWVGATMVFGALSATYWAAVAAGVAIPRLSFGATSLPSQLAGVATGMFYACVLVLLFRTAPGRAVCRVLAPLGRMALTNYLLATVIFVIASPLLNIDDLDDWPTVASLVVAIIVLELIISPLWLSRFRYGPIEWVWRCITWWAPQPFRRTA
ncbi:MAG: DUF418 domain-containing protein [Rhodococcus sp. (in: high G+C Gram-positive bacteria)]